MTWLVVGGAGYIGSHIVHHLHAVGKDVVVLDDLSSGRAESVPSSVPLLVADAADAQQVLEVVGTRSVTGIIHLAARKHARESLTNPLDYWRVNLGALLGLLEAAQSWPVKWVLLSSSCSVYGSAGEVSDETPVAPVSPYGATKVASEMLLKDWAQSRSAKWAALRYFNVIGNAEFPMAPDRSSECLVPVVTRRIRQGEAPIVFGGDFETPDGSAMRDYIDVRDVAAAHAAVAGYLNSPLDYRDSGFAANVSTGAPVSVHSIVASLAAATGWQGPAQIMDRREGDPDRIWSRPSPRLTELGWRPQFSLDESITSHVSHDDSRR